MSIAFLKGSSLQEREKRKKENGDGLRISWHHFTSFVGADSSATLIPYRIVKVEGRMPREAIFIMLQS